MRYDWQLSQVKLQYSTQRLEVYNHIAFITYKFRPSSQAEAYNYLRDNFQRHYTSNKAPFGVYLQANAWFQTTTYNLAAYLQFLDYLGTLDDVYIVSLGKVIYLYCR